MKLYDITFGHLLAAAQAEIFHEVLTENKFVPAELKNNIINVYIDKITQRAEEYHYSSDSWETIMADFTIHLRYSDIDEIKVTGCAITWSGEEFCSLFDNPEMKIF